MTESDLAAIEARAAEATPGPWVYEYDNDGNGHYVQWFAITVSDPKIGSIGRVYIWRHEPIVQPEADVRFIAHARADVPALCAALREAWKELGR